MKRWLGILSCLGVILLMGCGKITPNPYQLTAQAIKVMKPDQQEVYIQQIKDLEALVMLINDESQGEEKVLEALQNQYKACPKDWTWEQQTTPIDKSWQYFMLMMDGMMGCTRFEDYGTCKDTIDELANQLANYFKQERERQEKLHIDERRFYHFYLQGKEDYNKEA